MSTSIGLLVSTRLLALRALVLLETTALSCHTRAVRLFRCVWHTHPLPLARQASELQSNAAEYNRLKAELSPPATWWLPRVCWSNAREVGGGGLFGF